VPGFFRVIGTGRRKARSHSVSENCEAGPVVDCTTASPGDGRSSLRRSCRYLFRRKARTVRAWWPGRRPICVPKLMTPHDFEGHFSFLTWSVLGLLQTVKPPVCFHDTATGCRADARSAYVRVQHSFATFLVVGSPGVF
jgi:hypothetical protein